MLPVCELMLDCVENKSLPHKQTFYIVININLKLMLHMLLFLTCKSKEKDLKKRLLLL